MGTLTGLAAGWFTPPLVTAMGTGLLGGFTTFSTASLDTTHMLIEKRYVAAAINSVGMLVACVLCGCCGVWIGTAIL